jgi:hypothetical protein
MDMDRIRKALPVEKGSGGRSKVRCRPDVVQVTVDCVLRRKPFIEIAKGMGLSLDSLNRFRKNFITDEVRKIVLVEANKLKADALDEEVNDVQSDAQNTILEVMAEQKKLYRALNNRMADGERDLEDILPSLAMLLRDQMKSAAAFSKMLAELKNQNTIVLSLNEHPDVAKLMDALWVLFKEQPQAFERFKEIIEQKKIPLYVE